MNGSPLQSRRTRLSPPLSSIFIILSAAALVCLSPAGLSAQKKPKKALKDSDARRAIVAAEGFALNSGAVKIKDVSVAGVEPVVAAADVTLGIRFEQVEDERERADLPSLLKRKRWRAVEFRTGDRNWERIDLLAVALGAERFAAARAALEELLTEFEARQRASKSAEGNAAEDKGEEVAAAEPVTRGPLTIKQLTAFGSTVVGEFAVAASFRLERDARRRWRVAAVGVGDAQTVDVAALWRAVNAEKGERARAEMRAIREALEAYRRERGFYVVADSEVILMDHLSPRFIARVIRLDPWGRPYRYGGTRERYVLSSDGADGKRDTPDDVTLAAGG